jgi:ABC-type Zn2+ transport system substrate-binding protein/surface adhesin
LRTKILSVFIKEMKKAHEMKKVKALSFQLDDEEEEEGEEDAGHKDNDDDDDDDGRDDDDDRSKGKMNSEQSACCKIVSFQSFQKVL